ncbi:CGNR zinc finger domain-containing protein [Gemmatimonadota bacterium]
MSDNRICLEFTKTVGWEARDRPDDELLAFDNLVEWCVTHDLLDTLEAKECLAVARRNPEDAARVFRRALDLRSLVYRILSRVSGGGRPEASELEALNGLLPDVLKRRCLEHGPDGVQWGWRWDPPDLGRVLAPIILSVADLLASEELDRLRVCDGDGCGWLFIDQSRNRSRRWCDMGDCGNRAKAKRFRERTRTDRPDPGESA